MRISNYVQMSLRGVKRRSNLIFTIKEKEDCRAEPVLSECEVLAMTQNRNK